MIDITIDIPWTYLCPDNQKQIPVPVVAKYAGQKCVSRLMTSTRYKNGKAQIEQLARNALRRLPATSRYEGDGKDTAFGPTARLSLTAVAYPPTKRKTDPINYAKGVCDALQGIMYEDDNQIVSNGPWVLGPVDKDDPRIVVTIAEV